jgi:uncharacterized protein (AIM24 family)
MAEQSIDEFVTSTSQQADSTGTFVKETSELLEVNLDGRVWARVGSMVAYVGDVEFERESALEGGITKFLKKQVTGEGAPLMKMEGTGSVYIADRKKKISAFRLADEKVSVNGSDLLAFEDGIDWDIEFMKSAGGMVAGGLFNVSLSGDGTVVITSHGKPLTLRVEPDTPIYTDPQATVAWDGSLDPQIEQNMSMKSLIGRGSGESVQFRFQGDGWVLVQPYEEVPFQQQNQNQNQSQSSGGGLIGQLLGG